MDDEWRITMAAGMARIEQKVDDLSFSLSEHTRKFEVVEKRVWNQEGGQQVTAAFWTILIAVATIAGAIGPVVAAFVTRNFR